MNRSDRGPAALALLVVMAVAFSQHPPQAAFTYNSALRTASATDVREIEVTAQRYDFEPGVITVKQNEHIRLVITALDHDHGFKIGAFHIDQLLKKGQRTTVEFTADTPGTFPFQCSHFCGLGHKGMKGELVVEAASQESLGEQADADTGHFSNQ